MVGNERLSEQWLTDQQSWKIHFQEGGLLYECDNEEEINDPNSRIASFLDRLKDTFDTKEGMDTRDCSAYLKDALKLPADNDGVTTALTKLERSMEFEDVSICLEELKTAAV